ncbi:hypothetical protein, partial [Anaplasma marginale]|uniref:hypothetical protein n=1 Tax=Anaplasma marginale TaxID=770 RepID=UPI0005B4BCB3
HVFDSSAIAPYSAAKLQSIPLNNKQISRELAWRILKNIAKNKEQKAKLSVEEFPSQLPLEFPLPNSTKTVGSVSGEEDFFIFLEVPKSRAKIEQFYQQQLTENWKKSAHNYDPIDDIIEEYGFTPSGYRSIETTNFCNDKLELALSFNTRPSRADSTDLRLALNPISSNNACSYLSNEASYKAAIENANKTESML